MRNDDQTARACQALCDHLPALHGLWAPRPTVQPTYFSRRGISPGERVVWELAWAFWNGWEGKMRLCDLMRLDAGNTRRVAELMLAVDEGPEGVDRWLERHAVGVAS